MADCSATGGKYLGRRVLVQVDMKNCSDTYPLEADWQKIAPLTSKDLDFSADTVESTADDVSGGYKETYVTFQNAGFSFSGEAKEVYNADEVLQDMIIFRNSQLAAGKQPSMWIKVTTPSLTYTFWVNFTNYSEANPSDALSTFSLSFAATGSVLQAKVEKTIAP